MSLPREPAHLAPHVTTLGATRDESMAAELLRPLFDGKEAFTLLQAGQAAIEAALKARGLALGPAVLEPTIMYSLSLMDRQIRFEVVRPDEPEECLMQACVRLVGRLSFCRVPHDCQISVQLMLGKAEASTNFTYQTQPGGWQIRESVPVPVMRRGEHVEVLAGRWPGAVAQMNRFVPLAGVDSLCADAVRVYGRAWRDRLGHSGALELAAA